MLHPTYPITAGRLILRPFAAGDLDDLHDYHSRPDVARFVPWQPGDRAATQEALDRRTQQSALDDEGQNLVLAAIWPEAGRVVGEVILKWLSRENRQGELGFAFNPAFHGRGLATEAADAVLRLGFVDLGLRRIVGKCDPRNEASIRLMERLGMHREAHFRQNGIFKGEWCDLLVYALLDEEWQARAPSTRR